MVAERDTTYDRVDRFIAYLRGLLTEAELDKLTWLDRLEYEVFTVPAGDRLAAYFCDGTEIDEVKHD